MQHKLRFGWLGLCAALVGLADRAAAQADSAEALVALGEALQLSVTDSGPEQPWTLELSNRGQGHIQLVADPGLLWFEVVANGQTARCRLPEPLWPRMAKRASQIVLAPGESYTRTFDIRFFCFNELKFLVPGARLVPHFGWPPEASTPKAKAKRGAAAAPSGPPGPPFVAWPAPEPPAEPEPAEPTPAADEQNAPPAAGAPAETDAEQAPVHQPIDLSSPEPHEGPEPPAPPPPTSGLKELHGAAVVLADAYATWSAPDPALGSRALHVRMLAGSDAEDDKNATVTVALVNGSNVPQTIFARRELFDYEVTGPEGTFECNSFEVGSPDFASFHTLAPGAMESMTVRLIEMCPRSGLMRPGLYSVNARLDARWSGQSLGLEAFTGVLESQRPALVRVRTGDRSSFLRAANTLLTGVDRNAPQAPPPQMPAVPGEMPLDVPAHEPMPDSEAPVEAPPPAPPEVPVEGAVE